MSVPTLATGKPFTTFTRSRRPAKRLGVPKALGLSVEQWVNGRLGGYVRLNVEERMSAVHELASAGESNRTIAGVLGVDEATVRRDLGAANAAPSDQIAKASAETGAANAASDLPLMFGPDKEEILAAEKQARSAKTEERRAGRMEKLAEISKGNATLGGYVRLNESQRAMVAAKLATLAPGRPSETASIEAVSQAEAAEMLNVWRPSVQRARMVLESAAPELVQPVERGAIAVSTAADVASLPLDQQAEIVARGEDEILQAAKRIRASRSAAVSEKHEQARREFASLPAPDGVYRCIVVVSLNLHRRHLNESQRGVVAAKLANLENGQRASPIGEGGAAMTQRASWCGTSSGTTSRR